MVDPGSGVSFWVVYVEGLRSITRSKMSAIALSILLFAVGLFAAFVGTYADGKDVYFFLAYLIVPSGVAALAAIQIATPRTTKFVQAVFTAPVSRSAYFLAHVAVAFTVGMFYILFTLPLMALHVAHDALPPEYPMFLLAGVLLVSYGAAFGTLAGVLSTGRSIIPAALVGAIPILLLLCVPIAFVATWSWETDPTTGLPTLPRNSRILLHVAHASPHVNILDALGLWSDEVVPKHPLRSALWLAATTVGMALAASWIFLRLQGVEDWESGGRKQAAAGLLVLALLAAPALQPDADSYRPPPDGSQTDYDSFGNQIHVFVVKRGTPPDPFRFYSSRWEDPLRIGSPNAIDIVIPLSMPPGMNVTAIDLTFEGVGSARLEGVHRFVSDPWTPNETIPTFAYHSGPRQPMLRLAGTIFLDKADALSNARFYVNVTGRFTVSGVPELRYQDEPPEPQTQEYEVQQYAEFIGSVPGAQRQAAAIMAPLPIAFLVGGIVRWTRRR